MQKPLRNSTHRSPARLFARAIENAKPAAFPGFVEPCFPALRKVPPTGEEWVHEIKFDGYRAQAHFDKQPRILTRRGHDWTERFQVIADALSRLPANNIVLDGEVVATDDEGKLSFSLLQNSRGDRRGERRIYYAFDILYLDGFDLRAAPLIERKRVLQGLLKGAKSKRILFSDHTEADGVSVLEQACAMGLEEIVSKRRDAPYRSGKRPEWIKAKCAVAARQLGI